VMGHRDALQMKSLSKACSKNWNGLFCFEAEANSLSGTF
jgi:hypothetical protein